LIAQVTAGFVLPKTEAVNGCVWPADKLTAGGVTLTLTGTRVTTALPDLVESATLVAITVTEVIAGMDEGAV
jgi:hypothetical protein